MALQYFNTPAGEVSIEMNDIVLRVENVMQGSLLSAPFYLSDQERGTRRR